MFIALDLNSALFDEVIGYIISDVIKYIVNSIRSPPHLRFVQSVALEFVFCQQYLKMAGFVTERRTYLIIV
jgi:hypothetical protein